MPESSHRQWTWHVRIKPIVFRILGVVAACLSVFIVFGEIGILVGAGSKMCIFLSLLHRCQAGCSTLSRIQLHLSREEMCMYSVPSVWQ